MSDLLLLPSPLLGPASWAPVAAQLSARVAKPAGAITHEDVLTAYVDAAGGLADVVLVAHSNAGLYAPTLAERIGARATVYVDAALAGDGPETALAPQQLLAVVETLADSDGVLPPWTQWWEEPAVADLFPDAETRACVEAEQPRLPLSYFRSRVPVPAGWEERPSAYLAFGDTYADEIVFARSRDWPVTVLDGRHLHQLVAPADVAAAITDLVRRLGSGPAVS